MEPSARADDKLQAILDKLDGVRRSGRGFRAFCPVHEPGGKSARAKSVRDLAVYEGDTAIVIGCYAGCRTEDVVDSLGLKWADLFFDKPGRPRKRKPLDVRGVELEMPYAVERLQNEPEILARLRQHRGWPAPVFRRLNVGWDGERLNLLVRDEAGKVHDVLRYDPTGHTRGPKMLAGQGRTRYMWPSPELVDMTGHRWLHVVEGEGTVISLAALGLPAVALPGSAGLPSGSPARPGTWQGSGWHRTWARRLKRPLMLWPDGNAVGRALMHAVKGDVERESGLTVTTCDLGLDDGRDVGDWLRPVKTGTNRKLARELLTMFMRTARFQPERTGDAREILWAWHRELSGEELKAEPSGEGSRSSSPESSPLEAPPLEAPPWDWGAAA